VALPFAPQGRVSYSKVSYFLNDRGTPGCRGELAGWYDEASRQHRRKAAELSLMQRKRMLPAGDRRTRLRKK